MAEYFRDVDRPEALLPRERHPRSGRRVPKSRSKGREASRFGALTGRRLLAGVAAVAVAGGAAVVIASRDDTSTVGSGAAADTTVLAENTVVVAETTVPATVIATTSVAVTSSTAPPATTAPATSVAPLAPVRLQMEPVPATVQVFSSDPGGTASYNGPPPVFRFVVDCLGGTCSFPLSVNFPGAVTADGFNFVNAVDNQIEYTSSVINPCTGSQGTTYTHEIVSTTSLTLSGAQQIGDQLYPQRISGTLSTVIPEAGFVPHVGDAFPNGTETGCPGTTTIFTIDAPLTPVPS